MRLTKIRAENFKGRTFEYDLPPKLAIVGKNFVGKSAVIDAIRWLLTGFVPEVGKINQAMWELSSGDFMQVTGDIIGKQSLGYSVSRKLEQIRGSIKASGSAENLPEGAIPGLVAEHYFGLSDRERVNYVYAAVEPPKEFSIEALVVELDNITVEGIDPAALEKAKKEMGVFHTRLTSESIDNVLAEMREAFTYWNKREKDTIGAVRTLTELKLREKAVSAETLKEVTAELGKLRDLNEELARQIAEENYARQRAKDNTRERTRLQRILDSSFDSGSEADRYRRLIGEAEQKMKPFVVHTKDLEKITQLERERGEAIVGFESAKTTIDTFEKKQKAVKKTGRCPYCNSEAGDFVIKSFDSAIQFHKGVRDGFSKKLEEIEKQFINERARIDANSRAIQENTELTHNINHWKHQIELIEVKATNFKGAQAEAAKLIKELPTDNLMSEEDYETLTQKREELRVLIDRYQEREREMLKLQHDLKRAAESEQEHNHAKAMVKVIKKAAEILNERKKAMVEIVFSELLKTANSIFGHILKSPLSLFDNTIGRWDGAKFIPHRVFSGTEKALSYCAISAALSAKAPMKLAIIDEFSRLDASNQVLAMVALSEAVDAGVLEQFIVVGTTLQPLAGIEMLRIE